MFNNLFNIYKIEDNKLYLGALEYDSKTGKPTNAMDEKHRPTKFDTDTIYEKQKNSLSNTDKILSSIEG